jgi:hypothetical protein
LRQRHVILVAEIRQTGGDSICWFLRNESGLTVAALGALFSATPACAQALTDHYWLEAAAYWP